VDDGIVARLSAQRYWVNTTTAGFDRHRGRVSRMAAVRVRRLKVVITPVTSRLANITVAGPRAWEWLAKLGFEAALALAAMPHMTLRDSALDGVPLRVLRASFSGELGYEVNLPPITPQRSSAPVDGMPRTGGGALRDRGPAGDAGGEGLYIHIGTDTDGTTLPAMWLCARYRGARRRPSSADARSCGRHPAIRLAAARRTGAAR